MALPFDFDFVSEVLMSFLSLARTRTLSCSAMYIQCFCAYIYIYIHTHRPSISSLRHYLISELKATEVVTEEQLCSREMQSIVKVGLAHFGTR